MKTIRFLLISLLLGAFLESGESFGAGSVNTTQTTSGGGVTVKVTYLNPRSNEEPCFSVVLDTHSVALDGYDLNAITVLRDDTGKSYAATAVENKGGGHHREVTLTFPKLNSEAKRLEILIKDIGGVKERTFKWTLG